MTVNETPPPNEEGTEESSATHPSSLTPHASRREARVLAMQALCCLDVQGDGTTAAIDTLFAESEVADDARRRARALLQAARARRDSFEAHLKASVPAWDIARITMVDRNVLQAAAAEFSLGDVPSRVIINEAIEIAREYGSAESPSFVNGVLDALYRRLEHDRS